MCIRDRLSKLIPRDEKFAIAFSGGGDSTALVHALRNHAQAKYVYIVDHDLREGSKEEAQAANAVAISCGFDAKVMKWQHNSPSSALQEQARNARYALMGVQCRKDEIKYLLTAHSENDQAETLLMRYERKTDWRGAAGMTELTYGAIWPQLATVNIVRPLLRVSREVLRDYNQSHNLTWTEDPSNENRDYARIRARDYLKARPALRADLLETADKMREALDIEKSILRSQLSRLGKVDENGIIYLNEPPLPELMFHCLRCAGGQGVMIDLAKIKGLLSRIRRPSFKSATLGGAMVAKHKSGFIICRDPVAAKGRQDSHHQRRDIRRKLSLRLSDTPRIWDGRFLVTGPNRRSYMGAVYHNSESLRKEHRQALKAVPAPARPTLPVSKKENSIRLLGAGVEGMRISKSLVKSRLEAALGGQIP